jgi:hypothetical protein
LKLCFQDDGNLVVYGPVPVFTLSGIVEKTVALWASGSNGYGESLAVRSDCSIAISGWVGLGTDLPIWMEWSSGSGYCPNHT